jgi:hypothetical protein
MTPTIFIAAESRPGAARLVLDAVGQALAALPHLHGMPSDARRLEELDALARHLNEAQFHARAICYQIGREERCDGC